MDFKNQDYVKKVKSVILDNKFQWAFVLVLFLIILSFSSVIRFNNLDLLIDETTGEYIPTALDPYYFLRMTETYIENDYSLPDYDEFRYSLSGETSWHHEFFFKVNILIWKVWQIFDSDVSIRFVSVVFPGIFFILFLVAFFIFSYVLTKNKWIGLFSSSFIAFSSSMLYRGMAGFYDHDIPGMFMFILSLAIFGLILSKIKSEKKEILKNCFFGFVFGFFSILTYGMWTGVFRFFLIIIPICFLLIWIFKTKEERVKNGFLINFLLFYFNWILSIIIFGFVFGFSVLSIINQFISSTGLLTLFVLIVCLIDFILIYFADSLKKYHFKENYSLVYSFVISFILGFIGLFLIGKNPIKLIKDVAYQLLYPFGTSRVGLTVAENAQPFVSDWISNSGVLIFWMFLLGIIFLGINIAKEIKEKKHKFIFLFSYTLMICGIIFSKYSSTSLFNGENFISYLFYFVPLIGFFIYFIWLYLKGDFYVNRMNCFLFSIMFFTIVSGRSAVRVFFSIIPFMTFFAGYFLFEVFSYWRKSKDEVLKIILGLSFLFFFIFSLVFVYNSYASANLNSAYVTPSADNQWQNAMSWVRNNTDSDSVFAHWWDYGYWVQTLGERRTVSDGGHFQSVTNGNHNIGRYVLTTPNPDSALSYFKSMNVNYLLIDQTDLGKYTAYSKIGSDENWDRLSVIPVGAVDEKQTQETKTETISVYIVSGVVDYDIIYELNGQKIFLPGPSYDSLGNPTYKSYLIGVIFNRTKESLNQPYGVYYYNGNQIMLPLRYVYIENELFDFKSGVDSVVQIIPSLNAGELGYSVDPMGALIYLSPKVKDGLFAQLYLLDDAYGNYPNVELVHEEYDSVVKSLKIQNVSIVDEFIYLNGFRGPIKIWDVSEASQDSKLVEEFYSNEFIDKYAQLDYLFY